jgi:HD-GYP domain-containing protein (c-di-GMP phosphodiesterase class II)
MRKYNIKNCPSNINILALDDDPMMTLTLQSYFQAASGYNVDIEKDPLRAIERIKRDHYDILLLDFLMRPINGREVVKETRKFNNDIYIILLTGHISLAPPISTMRDMDIQGYFEKSDRFDLLELLIESCVKSIVQMRTIREYRDSLQAANERISRAYEQLGKNYEDMILMIRTLTDARDIYTRGHSDRVSLLAVEIAKEMQLSETTIERIRIAGLMHDIGKVRTPDSILLKECKLTDAEFDEMKKHSHYSYEILLNLPAVFSDILPAVLSHHERYDGTGYPQGLSGEEIPIEARIISIADAFDAMTSFRRYRHNFTAEEAKAEIQRCKGTQFDPVVAEVALRALERFDEIKKDPKWVYPVDENNEIIL